MIARAEAGSAREGMADFNVADVARDVAELYEPLAEEAGVPLAPTFQGDLPLHGSRELVGQALANLIDNAIKYSRTAVVDADAPLSWRRPGRQARRARRAEPRIPASRSAPCV